MIPKIVHFCWFGYGKKPEIIVHCIDSWHKYLPDWEFIEWNEDNYNVHKNLYISEAYKQKKWAFVADYARFDILNQYGGVYFDTDVELFKTIPMRMLEHEAFTGFQSNNRVNPGLVYGSIAGQAGTKELLKVYDGWKFNFEENKTPPNILDAFNEAFIPFGLSLDGRYQIVNGVAIYPNDYFCCYDFETYTFEKTANTISIHYFYASWLPKKVKVRRKIIAILVSLIGRNSYKRIKKYIKSKLT